MNELALFAGAGGGILGGHLLGWRTVCAVEWEPYPASVLCARQNDGLLPPFPIWNDVQTFDGKPWRGIVDVVSGGFPCQDISVAGKGAGIDGQRSGMWRHMARIVGEVLPRYVFVENSPALITRGLGTVLGDLAALGYDCRWTVLGAADVGAPHQRDRFWLVAISDADMQPRSAESREQQQRPAQPKGSRCQWLETGADVAHTASAGRNEGDLRFQGKNGCTSSERASTVFEQSSKTPTPMADPASIGQQAPGDTGKHSKTNGKRQADKFRSQGEMDNTDSAYGERNQCAQRIGAQHPDFSGSSWWSIEPNVGRVAHGVAARVDRLKAIGNGQVPLCAATAWRLLSET